MGITYMTDFTLKGTMKLNLFLLKICGLMPSEDQPYRSNVPYFIYLAISQILWHWTETALLAANAIVSGVDIENIADIIFILPNYIVTCIKSYFFAKNMDIIHELWRMSRLKLMQPRTPYETRMAKNRFKEYKFMHIIFVSSQIITDISMTLGPILDHTAAKGQLIFDNWFPFDYKVSAIYPAVYFFQTGTIFYSGTANINIDSMIGGIMLYVAAQCEILCHRLENLDKYVNMDGDEVDIGYETAQLKMKQNLVECIEHHKLIVSFTSKIADIIGIFVTVQLFASFLSICGNVFQIAVVDQNTDFVSLVSYNTAISLQLFLYCWFGDRIIEKSNLIPAAAYSCLWYKNSEDFKKMLIFFIMRTQKSMDITTMGIFKLSLELFVSIYKSAFSYATVLMQMNEEK